jgi:hypothetical protein
LKAADWIVLNPPDSLSDGQEVHVKEVPNPIAPAAAPVASPAPAPGPAPTPKDALKPLSPAPAPTGKKP